MDMTDNERAYWLADKIPACGDYAKEAARMLKKQADEIERMRDALERIINDCTARKAVMIARRALDA